METGAVKSAIRSGQISAAVLDVWESEPEIDCELLEMVDIGSPHIAGYSYDGKVRGMIMIYKSVCGYFGLKPKYEEGSFLPEPAVPVVKVKTGGREQAIIRDTVRKIYDINRDDRDLRQITNKPAGERGQYFDNLRKNYPVRREFQNTEVAVDNNGGGLAEKLQGIGFSKSGRHG